MPVNLIKERITDKKDEIEAYKKAIKIRPDYAETHYNLDVLVGIIIFLLFGICSAVVAGKKGRSKFCWFILMWCVVGSDLIIDFLRLRVFTIAPILERYEFFTF